MLLWMLSSELLVQQNVMPSIERQKPIVLDKLSLKHENEKSTQDALAKQIGTNKSYISKIENGLVEPSASLFLRILSALGLRFEIVKP